MKAAFLGMALATMLTLPAPGRAAQDERDQIAKAEAAEPIPWGVPRRVHERLIRARLEYKAALKSGDQGRIARAAIELRVASHDEWTYAYPHQPWRPWKPAADVRAPRQRFDDGVHAAAVDGPRPVSLRLTA